jgi:hypothetical protein
MVTPMRSLLVATTAVDTAARVLFSRIGLGGHDALLDLNDQSNVGVNPQSGDNGIKNEKSNRVAILGNFRIAQVVDRVDVIDRDVDSDCVVDDIPNDDHGEHPNVVEASTQQCHNGHDLKDHQREVAVRTSELGDEGCPFRPPFRMRVLTRLMALMIMLMVVLLVKISSTCGAKSGVLSKFGENERRRRRLPEAFHQNLPHRRRHC